MKKIELADIREIYDYDKVRKEFRKKLMEIKRNRRIYLGPRLSFLFENRETVLYQVHEMIRAEKLKTDDEINHEIKTYNELIPNDNELSCTMFVEISDPTLIKFSLKSFKGIETNCVSLKIGNKFVIYAEFDQKQYNDETISSTQYLKFLFSPDQKETFLYGNDIIFLCVKHHTYDQYVAISEQVKSALRIDLLSQ